MQNIDKEDTYTEWKSGSGKVKVSISISYDMR